MLIFFEFTYQNDNKFCLRRFILYSFFLIGLVSVTASYCISNTGLASNSSAKEDFLLKNSEQFSFTSLRTESKDLAQKAEQTNIVEIQASNEQSLSDNTFDSKLLWAKNLTHLQFFFHAEEYFVHLSFQKSNGHYLYFLCKILI